MNEQTTLPVDQPDSLPAKGRKPTERTLAAKLAEACDEVGGIEKKGTNEAQRYKYVKAADVAKEIRHKLFSRGVVIIPDEVECTNRQISFQNAKGETRNTNEVVIRTAYHITDGKETMTMHGYGIAWDSGDKAVYKAKTGALKYFLRGLGLIPDEKDDPEADESTDNTAKEAEYARNFDQRTANQTGENVAFGEKEQYLAPFQQKAILDAMVASGKSQDDLKTYLELAKVQDLAHVKKGEDFQALLKWANAKGKATSHPKKDGFNWSHLYASARDKGYSEQDVKTYYCQEFGVESGTQLTPLQFTKVVEAVARWAHLTK